MGIIHRDPNKASYVRFKYMSAAGPTRTFGDVHFHAATGGTADNERTYSKPPRTLALARML